MSLPVPNLDDRQFTGLVEQATVQIPRYAPEWTDHNIHDPGITFLELFAWLAEMQIYYLDRVPTKHELLFLRLLGFAPKPGSPARASVTFKAPNQALTIIPSGTQVATLSIGGSEPIFFETDVSLEIVPLTLGQVITIDRTGVFENTQANDQEERFYFAFGENAEEGSTLYLGLEFPASPPMEFFLDSPPQTSQLMVMVTLFEKDLPPRGVHGEERVDERCNPLAQNDPEDEYQRFFPSAKVAWEYWNGKAWVDRGPGETLLLRKDATCGFSWTGNLIFDLPPDFEARVIPPFLNSLYWLRCRVVEAGYEIPPRIESIRLNTIPVTQAQTVKDEETLGSSTQLPNQIFSFKNKPILAGTQKIEVLESGVVSRKPWREVPDFDASGPDDDHYLIDRIVGEVQFGDGVNGRIPPAGVNNIVAASYRHGGGKSGNVGAGAIQSVLDPQFSGFEVTNNQPAVGGTNEEKLRDTRRRALIDLRTPYQAVTSPDYEFLAINTPGLRVARAKALPLLEPPNLTGRQGMVTVAVVPFSFALKPIPSGGFLRTVCEHLNRHRLITTEVRVIPPDYVEVSVEATALLKPGLSVPDVRRSIEDALNKFLNPISGGVGGKGWEFGRSVYQSEIYQVIEKVRGVDCVMRVALAATGNFQFDGNNIKLTRPHGLVYPGTHQLDLIDPQQRCEVKGPCHEPKK